MPPRRRRCKRSAALCSTTVIGRHPASGDSPEPRTLGASVDFRGCHERIVRPRPPALVLEEDLLAAGDCCDEVLEDDKGKPDDAAVGLQARGAGQPLQPVAHILREHKAFSLNAHHPSLRFACATIQAREGRHGTPETGDVHRYPVTGSFVGTLWISWISAVMIRKQQHTILHILPGRHTSYVLARRPAWLGRTLRSSPRFLYLYRRLTAMEQMGSGLRH